MSDTTPRRETRDAILDAAATLVSRYGYKKTTMNDIARGAHISKATIYLYFPSKEEVALSYIDRVNERIVAALDSLAARPEGPCERLRQMLVARVMLALDSVQGMSDSLQAVFGELRPAFLERRERHRDAQAKVFARVLQEAAEQEGCDVAEPLQTAYPLLWATDILLPDSLSPAELGERGAVQRKAERIAHLLLRGLAAPGPA